MMLFPGVILFVGGAPKPVQGGIGGTASGGGARGRRNSLVLRKLLLPGIGRVGPHVQDLRGAFEIFRGPFSDFE